MTNKGAPEALDWSLKGIRDSTASMGGATLLLPGDLWQTLPIIPKGSWADEVYACLKSSTLWPKVKTLSLSTNMPPHLLGDSMSAAFAEDILTLGEGKVPRNDSGDISISELCNTVDNPSDLLETVFPNLENINWFSERTNLAPKTVAVKAINDQLISRIPGEERIYKSIDQTSDPQDIVNYPIEFLNSLEPAGLPHHVLRLRVGCPIMLIRNLLPPKQCNGTRLVIKSLMPHIITGCRRGENVFISRMQFYPSGSDMPFNFHRSQFLVRPCFAMSINKSQGQTLLVAGIHLGFSIQTG
uniref:ATP-dependent DNA helicase n=1 Tax=Octopus bimaculoides TaxID=37653 RepID=A0A0L8I6J8_OCTBM